MPRLPASGPLAMSQINAEFKKGNNLGAYLNAVHDAGRFPMANIAFSNFYGRISVFSFDHVATGNVERWDLYEFARGAGWDGVVPLNATFTVNPNVVVLGTANSAAMLAYGFPAGSLVTIVNHGYIVGRGGAGGLGDGVNIAGGAGHTALYTRSAITILNYGVIGGGGGGGRAAILLDASTGVSAAGGGGASYGAPNGGFGPGQGEDGNTALTRRFGPGNGGLNPGATRGGTGGGWGQPGQGSFAFDGTGPYDSGGPAGAAIDGAAFCTFSVSGDIRGAIG